MIFLFQLLHLCYNLLSIIAPHFYSVNSAYHFHKIHGKDPLFFAKT